MDEKRKCLVGHDSDDDVAWTLIMALIMALIAIMVVVIIVCGGAFIGGFESLKNYFISFKHNVYDSNRNPVSVG